MSLMRLRDGTGPQHEVFLSVVPRRKYGTFFLEKNVYNYKYAMAIGKPPDSLRMAKRATPYIPLKFMNWYHTYHYKIYNLMITYVCVVKNYLE